MPLDAWMPKWDARSVHQVEVMAAPEVVYQALLRTDFGRNRVLRLLMVFRAIPAVLLAPRRAWQRWRRPTPCSLPGPMGQLLAGAFAELEARPPAELILGLTGRFWTPAGDLVPTTPLTFRDPIPPGLARAAWNFQLEALGPNRTLLTTETRVLCGDEGTRRRFLRYWGIIQPGSGMIRRALLRQVKAAAEGLASVSDPGRSPM